MKNVVLITITILAALACTVKAQDIALEFEMPGSMYGPGSSFYLDMHVANTGPRLSDAQVFVALTIGTGDYWFYPSWSKYPPNGDWKNMGIAGNTTETLNVLPVFVWPDGAGAFDGALFLGAIVHGGELVSNLAEFMFGWSEEPPPTPTQTPLPTNTPTQLPPTSTPTPVSMEFVSIPSGTYLRGAPFAEPCKNSFEEPQHQVNLTRAFYMMTTEVTRHMWAVLKAAQPTLPDDPSDTSKSPSVNHPVQMISWNETVLFANLQSLENGYTPCYYTDSEFTTPVDATNYLTDEVHCDFNADGYRLPTEAEWEYAARAGTTDAFSTHEPDYYPENCNTYEPDPPLTVLDSIAWWGGNSDTGSGRMAHPVGAKLPNPWGLYDVHGNVLEFCWDWWNWDDSYPSSSVTDPTGPASGSGRTMRGGGNTSWAGNCRSAARSFTYASDSRTERLGFRLVRTAS